jgi:hypothetical protein
MKANEKYILKGYKDALTKAIEENSKNRKSLEFLVRVCLDDENSPISISLGSELLGFKTMNELREWRDKDGK